jgi:hypothetical protein
VIITDLCYSLYIMLRGDFEADPIGTWQFAFPKGVSDHIRTQLPVSRAGSLLLGEEPTRSTLFEPVYLGVRFDIDDLVIDIKGEDDRPFKGLIVGIQKIQTGPFNRLLVRSVTMKENESSVKTGNDIDLTPIPEEYAEKTVSVLSQTIFRLVARKLEQL